MPVWPVFLMVTQGTSPGVVAEVYHNIVEGRVVDVSGGVLRGRVERVAILATSHPLVVLAARTAVALLTCCMGFDPHRVELRVAPCEDVVDVTSYNAFYEVVREELERVLSVVGGKGFEDYRVVLDVTGGRVGMALAAFEAVNKMVTRGRVRVTTTQVPPEKYKTIQDLFTSIRGKLEKALEEFDRLVKQGRVEEACRRLREETRSDKGELCNLVTKEAVTAVLWPPPP